MSFTTWICDPKIELKNLVLMTKAQSYAFGRRLYRFEIQQQPYWLKFHHSNTHEGFEQALLRELDFYQHGQDVQGFLLPHQIIQLNPFKQQLDCTGDEIGLVTVAAKAFFSPLSDSCDIEFIKQKIVEALDALNGLHQAGWIHGDLKVEHFRVHANVCKLIDFEQTFRIGQSIQTLDATPHYMAPELFHGAGKRIQSDLYAFGIIVYEWLTQTRLQAQSYHEWAMLHCQQLYIQLPERLQCFLPVLTGLLSKHVQQRLSSVEAVKSSLNAMNSL